MAEFIAQKMSKGALDFVIPHDSVPISGDRQGNERSVDFANKNPHSEHMYGALLVDKGDAPSIEHPVTAKFEGRTLIVGFGKDERRVAENFVIVAARGTVIYDERRRKHFDLSERQVAAIAEQIDPMISRESVKALFAANASERTENNRAMGKIEQQLAR